MSFTQEELNELKSSLIADGIKDSQLPAASALTGNETVAVIQDRRNKQTTVTKFCEKTVQYINDNPKSIHLDEVNSKLEEIRDLTAKDRGSAIMAVSYWTNDQETDPLPTTDVKVGTYAFADNFLYKWDGTEWVRLDINDCYFTYDGKLYHYVDGDATVAVNSGKDYADSITAVTNTVNTVSDKVNAATDKINTVSDAVANLQNASTSSTMNRAASSLAEESKLNGTTIVLPTGVTVDNAEKLYPEYYLSEVPKYCPNYWEWPLVWYNGEVTIPESEIMAGLDAEAKFPSQWINKYSKFYDGDDTHAPLSHTARDVYYNTVTKSFVIYNDDDTHYYSSWYNSDVWNGADGHPMQNVLYAKMNVSGDTKETYKWDGEKFVDMLDGVTDFYDAIVHCLTDESTRTLYLKPNKTYYISKTIVLNDGDNYLIEGQNANIFRVNTKVYNEDNSTLRDHGRLAIFYVEGNAGIANCVIQNVNMRSIKDSVSGSPSGTMTRPSDGTTIGSRVFLADSRITGIACVDLKDGLTVRNVEFTNMEEDFTIQKDESDNVNVIIDGWYSQGCTQNLFSAMQNFTVRNAHIVSNPYSNSGHILYLTNYMDNVLFENCHFEHGGYYSAVMCQVKNIVSRTDGDRTITFNNCDFLGGKFFLVNTVYSDSNKGKKPYNLVFNDCSFHQLWRFYMSDGGYLMQYKDDYLIEDIKSTSNTLDGGDLTLNNCNVTCFNNYIKDVKSNLGTLTIKGGTIHQVRLFNISSSLKTISWNSSRTVVQGVLTNVSTGDNGNFGATITDLPVTDSAEIEALTNEVDSLKSVVFGSSTTPSGESLASAPLIPAVGDTYYNTTDEKWYKCTDAGTKGRRSITIKGQEDPNGKSYTLTFVLSSNESYTVTLSNFEAVGDTIDERRIYCISKIKEALEEQGATCSLHPTYPAYLRIDAKYPEPLNSGALTSNSDDTTGKFLIKGWGSFGVSVSTDKAYNIEGVAPTWEEIITSDTTSISAKTAANAEAITALQTELTTATSNLNTVKTSVSYLTKTENEGTTANRPLEGVVVGTFYFDTDLNKPIWAKKVMTTTDPSTLEQTVTRVEWVDASGTLVSESMINQ